MNIDSAEINKFDALAHKWWCQEGEFKTLHQVNPLRIKFIQDCVGDLKGFKVLDIGCGGGILAEGLAHKGAKVTGIDMAKASIEVAKLHLLESQFEVNYQYATAEAFADKNPKRYDIVTCMEMLEHVPDPVSIIRAASQLVKDGGWVFFSTLNRNLKSYVLSIILAEHVFNLIPSGTHQYDRFIKPYELVSAAQACQLSPVAIKGIHYNPLTQKFSIGMNVDVNYIVALKAGCENFMVHSD